MVSDVKDPRHVRAGKAAAAKRWPPGYTPKILKLHELTGAQRHLVLALVSAAREANDVALVDAARSDNAKAAPVIETPGAATSEGHGNDRPTD